MLTVTKTKLKFRISLSQGKPDDSLGCYLVKSWHIWVTVNWAPGWGHILSIQREIFRVTFSSRIRGKGSEGKSLCLTEGLAWPFEDLPKLAYGSSIAWEKGETNGSQEPATWREWDTCLQFQTDVLFWPAHTCSCSHSHVRYTQPSLATHKGFSPFS